MDELFQSGRIVDIILGLMLLECLALWLFKRTTGIGPPFLALLPNLAAGGFLLLAVRSALTGADWFAAAFCLAMALLAHIADLVFRFASWRAGNPQWGLGSAEGTPGGAP
jgi:hypothetical protein